MNQRQVIATARDAGRNVVHQVIVDGEVVGSRRSAHRYAYAICEWVAVGDRVDDGSPYGRYVKRIGPDGFVVKRVIVRSWSRNAKASGAKFAVAVEDAAV